MSAYTAPCTCMSRRSVIRWGVLPVACALSLAPITACAQSFTDVPRGDAIFHAVEELKSRNILSGFADGTFRPDLPVQRAEAMKILVTAKGVAEALRNMTLSAYDDVARGSWYLPYVEYARQELKIIDGPPKTTHFYPGRTVTKAEFLKMLMLSQGMDPSAYGEIRLPLASDVVDANAWYYPYVRLAFATSATVIAKSGRVSPDRALTRGDVALLLYRLLLYKEGRRTQDLLTEIEGEVKRVVDALNAKDARTAEEASARALLAARGAKTITPDEPLVNAAVKVAEAYRAIARGYTARTRKLFDDAIKLYKDAWFIAQKAQEQSTAVRTIAAAIQKSASQLAEEARKSK